MTLTCINDVYDERALRFFQKFESKHPVAGNEYTVRKVVIIKDHYFLLLNEIVNPELNTGEIPFHYSRFTDVEGNVLEWETVDKFFKKQL